MPPRHPPAPFRAANRYRTDVWDPTTDEQLGFRNSAYIGEENLDDEVNHRGGGLVSLGMIVTLQRAALVAAALVAVIVGAPAQPAAAGGGDFIYPVLDRYEPGETVTMVGYTTGIRQGPDGTDVGTYYGYLRVDPAAALRDRPGDTYPYVHPTDIRLDEVDEQPVDGDDYWTIRASLTFDLPADLRPGNYEVFLCDDPCTWTLGFLFESPLYVGVDPPEPVVRVWAFDDPLIASMDPEGLVADLTTPTWMTAAELLSGERSADPAEPATNQPLADLDSALPSVDRDAERPASPPSTDDASGGRWPLSYWLVTLALVAALARASWWWLGQRRNRGRGAAPDRPARLPSGATARISS